MAQVLLVEDDRDLRATVRDLLEEEGHQVTVAGNGVEAMAALRSMARPAFILLDLMLPVVDGWRVLEAIRNDIHLASVPVVIASASPIDDKVKAKATAIVRKPYKLEQLLEVVNRLAAASPSEPEGERLLASGL